MRSSNGSTEKKKSSHNNIEDQDESENLSAHFNPPPYLEKLLEFRIIFLSGFIDEEKAHELVSRLIALDYQNPKKDILFYIDSYGGEIYSLVAIHDTMKMLRCDVATICIAKAMSAGAILLLAGTKGKRFITPNARVMLHEISSEEDEGRLSDLRDSLKETEKLQGLLEILTKKYTKISATQIKEIFAKNTYMDASTAKKYGVVDHIITHPEIIHQHTNI
jgi:ATP-dependent Clp protease protease subunit